MPRSVTLTNSALASLLKNADVVQKIPQLRGPAKVLKAAGGCNCGGTKAKRRARALNDMKVMMRNWTPAQKRALKQALGAEEVQFYAGKKMVKF